MWTKKNFLFALRAVKLRVRPGHLDTSVCSNKSPDGQSIDEHCVLLCLDDEVKTKCATHTYTHTHAHTETHTHTLTHTYSALKPRWCWLLTHSQMFSSNWFQVAYSGPKRQFLHSNKHRLSVKSSIHPYIFYTCLSSFWLQSKIMLF